MAQRGRWLMAAVSIIEERERHVLRLARQEMGSQALGVAGQPGALMNCRANIKENRNL